VLGLLHHKGQKQTYRSIRQITKETDLTKSSIVQIIHCIFSESIFCLSTRLLSMIATFSCIYISQGSVATQLAFDGIFNNHVIANCPRNVPVKIFWKFVNIWWRYRQSRSGTFLGHSVVDQWLVQVFSYTKKKSLQSDDLCLDVSALGGPVKLYQCHGLGGNQLWQYDHQVRLAVSCCVRAQTLTLRLQTQQKLVQLQQLLLLFCIH